MNDARRTRRLIAFVLAALALYGTVSLFTMLQRSPFQVAVDRACALGGWEAEPGGRPISPLSVPESHGA